MLRICDNAGDNGSGNNGILGVDERRKQVTLVDPGGTGGPNGITPEERRVGVSAPKMFAFDGIFSEDDDQVGHTQHPSINNNV
jgi:kinesin family protein 26